MRAEAARRSVREEALKGLPLLRIDKATQAQPSKSADRTRMHTVRMSCCGNERMSLHTSDNELGHSEFRYQRLQVAREAESMLAVPILATGKGGQKTGPSILE